jgi:hypothetical protein
MVKLMREREGKPALSEIEEGLNVEGFEFDWEAKMDEIREENMRKSAEINPNEFAFAVLVTGSITAKAEEFANWIGNIVPPFNQLNESLKYIGDEIIKMARASCEKALNELEPGSKICFDGSWEHRRNSHRCITDVCCLRTGKVIAYAIMSNLIPEDRREYCKVPQNMEVAGLRLLLPSLMCHPEICGYCHDKDAKTSKLIREANWGIQEYLDPGHAMKSFERALNKYPLLKGISESLRKFMKHLLHWGDVSIEKKKSAWINAFQHYCGYHTFCPFEHKQNKWWPEMEREEVRKALLEFLGKTKDILGKCNSEFSTQLNESFHRLKLKYATKDVKWNFTWEARMACAVLDRNQPFWKLTLYKRLGLPPLPVEAVHQLVIRERERIVTNLKNSNASKNIRHNATARLNGIACRKVPNLNTQLDYKENPYLKK